MRYEKHSDGLTHGTVLNVRKGCAVRIKIQFHKPSTRVLHRNHLIISLHVGCVTAVLREVRARHGFDGRLFKRLEIRKWTWGFLDSERHPRVRSRSRVKLASHSHLILSRFFYSTLLLVVGLQGRGLEQE